MTISESNLKSQLFSLYPVTLITSLICCLQSIVLAQTTREEVAPGFYMTRIEDSSVPIRITALEINIGRTDIHIRSALANDTLGVNNT